MFKQISKRVTVNEFIGALRSCTRCTQASPIVTSIKRDELLLGRLVGLDSLFHPYDTATEMALLVDFIKHHSRRGDTLGFVEFLWDNCLYVRVVLLDNVDYGVRVDLGPLLTALQNIYVKKHPIFDYNTTQKHRDLHRDLRRDLVGSCFLFDLLLGCDMGDSSGYLYLKEEGPPKPETYRFFCRNYKRRAEYRRAALSTIMIAIIMIPHVFILIRTILYSVPRP